MTLLKNTYEIETDNLVFILRNPETDSNSLYPKLEILGYYKKTDKKTVYVFSSHLALGWLKKDLKEELSENNINVVSANKYILQNVLDVVYDKLKTKLANNLTNYEMYSWNNPKQWLLETKLKNKLDTSYSNIYLDEVLSNEAIKFRINGYYMGITKYDLFKDEILEIYHPETKESKDSLLVYVNTDEKNYLVAEAYQKGVAPKVVQKIKELMDWFENKKSIRLVLNDGTEHKLNREPDISYLLKYDKEKNEYVIKDDYKYTPYLEKELPLDKVKGFKYGNSLFELNKEDFEIPEF